MKEIEMYPTIEESFRQYAGAVLQSRALVDVRDCLKPSARQIFYCLQTDKFTYDKPYKKVLKMIGSVARLYIHGDASAEGIIMRAGQPFSYRYPLIDVKGNGGTLQASGNWAAPRYPDAKMTKLASYLFEDIEKETISEWRLNYDDTEEYPTVLPTKGFYNIVNGTMGIGVGAASSIPSFNLNDVNNALITLIKNPDATFDEIYCAPDFPTGGILLNEAEVKESLKNGTGRACKLRAVIEYDSSERCLIVKEIPYGVYTNTICHELEEILNNDPKCGIDRFNDLTGDTPNIKIYLNRLSNPSSVLHYLYKNTSLQSHYGINMTMLENGRFPRVFGWKEALQAHVNHEIEVYRKGYEYDLKKVQARIHIVEGIITAIANIEEVIKTIKASNSSTEANVALQKLLNIDEIQAKAILAITLARLAHLEVQKYEEELINLQAKEDGLLNILSNEEYLHMMVIKGWEKVKKEFGDARRTKIMNIESDEDEEPIEKKQMIVHLTNQNNVYAYEDSTLVTQRRGGTGTKFKLNAGEMIISTIFDSNYTDVYFYTSKGKVYNYPLSKIQLESKIPINSLIEIEEGERVTEIISGSEDTSSKYITFVTANGIVKRTRAEEYQTKRSKGLTAIKLKDGDSIAKVFLTQKSDDIALASKDGYFIEFNTDEITPTGRATAGVKGITLRADDKLADAALIPSDVTEILSITKNGMVKKTPVSELSIGSRANKGVIIHKLQDGDSLAVIKPITKASKNIMVSSQNTCIKFSLSEVNTSGRNTIGTKSIKLKDGNYVTNCIIE